MGDREERYLRGMEIRALTALPSALDLLDLRSTAVDKELDAGNEAAVVGGEEDNCLRNLFGCAEPAHGDEVVDVGEALFAFFAAAEEFTEAFGVDGSRAYDVDADVASLQIGCPGAGEGADCGFGC